MSSTATTFVEASLAGDALLDDVDDWVDVWHDSDGAPRGAQESLESYLGFNDFEYALWAERPSLLRVIVSARRQNRPVADVRSAAQSAVAAARTTSDSEAKALIEWLRSTGRLTDDDLSEIS